MSKLLIVSNLELALIRSIRSWFNVTHISKDSLIELVGTILNNKPELRKIDNTEAFVGQFYSLKLNSFYRRLNSPEVERITQEIENSLQLEQIDNIMKKFSLVLRPKNKKN